MYSLSFWFCFSLITTLHVMITVVLLVVLPILCNPGHKILRTEDRTEITENQTEIIEIEIFDSYFGSDFSGTELPR